MKIYLDNCSLQRPLDSKTQIRISLEAEAVLGILALLEVGNLELISSEVLSFEIGRNPNPARQEYALEVLSAATLYVQLTDAVEQRARELQALGFKPLDAAHLASAEAAHADFFCTCDDRLLKRAKALTRLGTRVVSPIELTEELEP